MFSPTFHSQFFPPFPLSPFTPLICHSSRYGKSMSPLDPLEEEAQANPHFSTLLFFSDMGKLGSQLSPLKECVIADFL